jgi:hypothetical protein
MSEAVLFISRPQPDGLNARKVMLPFDQIVAVKFPDVFELEVFEPVGFRKKFEATSHAAGANGDERDGAGSVADADAEVHTADQLARGLDAEVVDVNLDAPLSARGEVSLSGLAQLEQHVFGDALDVQAEGPDAGERRDAPSVVKGEAG